MSPPLDNTVFSLVLRGWRDRSTGTLHLGACRDFENLDAELIEDADWLPEKQYDRLCPICFPAEDKTWPRRRTRLEPYGY